MARDGGAGFRYRLRQAFGRLIRSATDRGVFALLDRQTPTRLLSAFPHGVEGRRVGLAQAVGETRGFWRQTVRLRARISESGWKGRRVECSSHSTV